jgi:hypothetical protein
MSDEAEEELVYVKMSTADILLLIAQLSSAVAHLVTATTDLSRGSNASAEAAAGKAGRNVDKVVTTIKARLEEGLAANERR